MNERYKAILDRRIESLKRRSGTLGRIGNGRTAGATGKQDDLLVSLSSSNGKHCVNVRLTGDAAKELNVLIGDFITIDYDNQPEGCLFVIRKTDERSGCSVYKARSNGREESGVRSAFTPRKEDLENLFPDGPRQYRCLVVSNDVDSGVFVFEEIVS